MSLWIIHSDGLTLDSYSSQGAMKDILRALEHQPPWKSETAEDSDKGRMKMLSYSNTDTLWLHTHIHNSRLNISPTCLGTLVTQHSL